MFDDDDYPDNVEDRGVDDDGEVNDQILIFLSKTCDSD